MRRFDADRRAVSTTLGYILTLSVATLLIAGLLVGLGDFVEDKRQGTARDELQVVGQQVASDLSAADRLARTGTASEVRVSRDLPDSITGSSYIIEIEGGDPVQIELRTDVPEVTVTVGVRVETTVVDASIGGGDVVVTLNPSGQLEVDSA